jgi:putative tryptophan/tyrosine transport system substrate-binding protein
MSNRQPAYAVSRGEFAILLGGGVVTWPLSADAEQRASPVLGYLYVGTEPGGHFLEAFRKGLDETGYVEGRNVELQIRFPQNEIGRLPQMIADLLRRQVAVIVTPGSLTATLAAKAVTRTIPIVFGIGGDPVALGLVSRLNRPDGNLTGVTFLNVELVAKRLQLLSELVPAATRFAVLVNPNSSGGELMLGNLRATASSIGRQIDVLYAATGDEIDGAFASLVQKRADALLVNPDVLFANNNVQVVTLAAQHRIPAIYGGRDFTEVGGLMSYGDKRTESFRWMGVYTGRILKGQKTTDLPVMQPLRFEFIINLQTARTLGLKVPRTLLAFADELIG